MQTTRFVCVDESKIAPFRLAATVIRAGDVATVRRGLQRLLLPNQQRLHFKSERDQRRRAHLQAMAELPVEVWIYEAETIRSGEIAKRSACLLAPRTPSLGKPGRRQLPTLSRGDWAGV